MKYQIRRSLLFLGSFLFYLIPSFAQKLYTKDGVAFGERSAFIVPCVKGVQQKAIEIKGLKIDGELYCSCVADNLIPQLSSQEIMDAYTAGRITELFTSEKNLQIIYDCVLPNVSAEEDFVFHDSLLFRANDPNQQLDMEKINRFSKQKSIDTCIMAFLENDPTGNIEEIVARNYCQCAIDKLWKSGLSFGQVLQAEDESSISYKEIVQPCLLDALEQIQKVEKNSYAPTDIRGKSPKSVIPLTTGLNKSYKIKLSIDGTTRYFIFDTGASDMIINRELERELLKDGVLTRANYRGKKTYMLADGREIEVEEVRVNRVKMGDFEVDNVTIGIVEKGSLLCGKSLLDKFQKWEVDSQHKQLTVWK